jgi:hypothetical protein
VGVDRAVRGRRHQGRSGRALTANGEGRLSRVRAAAEQGGRQQRMAEGWSAHVDYVGMWRECLGEAWALEYFKHFRWLIPFSVTKEKNVEGKVILGGHLWVDENNMVFSAATKTR